MAGMDLPVKAIREQIAGAVDLIVQIGRLSDGSRKSAKHYRSGRSSRRYSDFARGLLF